jgi:hypothetical protein
LLNCRKLICISVFLFILFSAQKSNGQKEMVVNMPTYDSESLFHFGFVLGGDMSYVTIRPISDLNTRMFDSTYIPDILPMPDSARILSITSTPTPGFVISIVSNLHLGDNFDLRFIPSLSFGDRTLIYSIQTYKKGKSSLTGNISKSVPSTYINFPLELKFKSKRYNNFRAYLLGGVQYTLDLASQAKKREQKNADQKIVKFKQNDVYVETGVGFDFYNEWFKFGVEFKMLYGLMDVLKRENNIYTDGIESLKSKIFQISLTFE